MQIKEIYRCILLFNFLNDLSLTIWLSGDREEAHHRPRDNGTTGHRANGTPGQRANGTPGNGQANRESQRDNGRGAGKLQGKHAWDQQARQPSNKTWRRMARERRRACYSVVSSIKNIVISKADDQQQGDWNAMSDLKQK